MINFGLWQKTSDMKIIQLFERKLIRIKGAKMSENLYAETKNGEIELWKTPTQITYMCLVNVNGEIVEKKNKQAQLALQIYLQWVKESINGIYSSQEQIDNRKQAIESHIQYIKRFLNEPSLKVYFL